MSVEPVPVASAPGRPGHRARPGPESDAAAQARSAPVLRLLMVDDHLMLTEALSLRLSATPDLWVVGRFSTADAALCERIAELRPDVVTVDVEPFARSCGRVLDQLGQACPSARIVVLTSSRDVRCAVEAARAGASAWLPKEHGVEALTDVLRGACRGHAWFPPEVLGAVLRELREDARNSRERSSPLDVLSDRERDVLAGLADGKRGTQIAEDLLISAQTVRTHTRSILAKLHVHSQLEAVSVARSAGLAPPGVSADRRGVAQRGS